MVVSSRAKKGPVRRREIIFRAAPPYGIKFGSNWQVSTRDRDVKDGKAEYAPREPEVIKAFRDTWALGIHSYLSYLRDRVVLARDLLSESGSIFVQIGDGNVHLLRSIMDEVFGAENFCSLISFKKSSSQTTSLLTATNDFICWYARNKDIVKFRRVYNRKNLLDDEAEEYQQVINENGERRPLNIEERADQNRLSSEWKPFRPSPLTSQGFRLNTTVDFVFRGKTYHPGTGANWKTTLSGLDRLQKVSRL